MSDSAPRRTNRQLVGRRLGLEPYYTIAERTATYLVLQSRPRANARVGSGVVAQGGTLIVLALLIACSGLLGGMQAGGGWGVILVATAIGGLLGGLGLTRLIGGIAIASTTNRIAVDAEARTITYTQTNRIARERKQTLAFEQVNGIRLTQRQLLTRGTLSRRHPITVLELVVDTQFVWIVDSAGDAESLLPLANALSETSGVAFAQEVAADAARV